MELLVIGHGTVKTKYQIKISLQLPMIAIFFGDETKIDLGASSKILREYGSDRRKL